MIEPTAGVRKGLGVLWLLVSAVAFGLLSRIARTRTRSHSQIRSPRPGERAPTVRGPSPFVPDADPAGSARGLREKSVAVVVPSVKEDVLTVDSIPDGVDHEVVRDGTINEARNAGVRNTDADVVAVMDDDIAFPEETFEALVDRVDPDTLVAMEDWNYGWGAGRVMVFHRELWEDVGGFEEDLGNHMGDTEFSLKALEHGYSLETVDRGHFYHQPHDRDVDWRDHCRGFGHLLARYPHRSPRIAVGLLVGKFTEGPWLKDLLFDGHKVDLPSHVARPGESAPDRPEPRSVGWAD